MNQLLINLAGYLALLPGLSMPTLLQPKPEVGIQQIRDFLIAETARESAGIETVHAAKPSMTSDSRPGGVFLIVEIPMVGISTAPVENASPETIARAIDSVVSDSTGWVKRLADLNVRHVASSVSFVQKHISAIEPMTRQWLPQPMLIRTKFTQWFDDVTALVGNCRFAMETAMTARMKERERSYWQYYRDCDNWGVVFQQLPGRWAQRSAKPVCEESGDFVFVTANGQLTRQISGAAIDWMFLIQDFSNDAVDSIVDVFGRIKSFLIERTARKFCPQILGINHLMR